MTCDAQNPIFNDLDAARQALEAVRWPDGPVCPHCGTYGDRIVLLAGKSHRPGLYFCNECQGQFTVTVGTVFERSKIPLTKWWLATHLLNSSKKGISAHQMHRLLGVTYKTAWFMMHRIREAMRTDGLEPMGGNGKIVEADETYFGRVQTLKPARRNKKTANRRPILALVERGGKVRTFHIPSADKGSVQKIVTENISHESRLHTDESRLYGGADKLFAAHETVQHTAREYVRGDVTTNSVEGYFSIFKRGMRGVYQHCKEKHLHRYLAEFDFRYNNRTYLGVNDGERAVLAMKGIEGKRLTYRPTHSA
jgi:transposase-like protein